jgi:hypothetical protein
MKALESGNGIGGVNLSSIREAASRFDLATTEKGNGRLLVTVPASQFPQNPLETVTKYAVSYDITNSTLAETEFARTLKDGTVVTATTNYTYKEKNGVPIMTSHVMVIDSKAPGLVEGFDPKTPYYNSWDDIPTMSEAEYKRLKAQGLAHEIAGFKLGNPADLSYTETVTTIYKNLEINAVSDSLFRIAGGEK